MFAVILALVGSAFVGAVLTYSLIAVSEGQWYLLALSAMVGLPVLIGIAVIAGIFEGAERRKRYLFIRQQRRMAPAVVTGLKSIGSDDYGKNRYQISATVYPPDMPPYRAQFEEDLDPIADAGVWQRGMVIQVQLVNIDNGGVIKVRVLDASVIPEDSPKPKPWEQVRRDYIEGDAPGYRGPRVEGVRSAGWRSVEIPQRSKLRSPGRPALWTSFIAGIAIMVLLCLGSITNTIERVQRGELSTTVYESSVIARAGAQDILDRSGSDKFYVVSLTDNGISADVKSERLEKVEDWKLRREEPFPPGRFGPWTNMTVSDYSEMIHGTEFGIDDVRWENLPKIVSDAREVCKRDYPTADLDFQQVLISVKNDQLQFEYRVTLTTRESCELSYTMAGKPIGR